MPGPALCQKMLIDSSGWKACSCSEAAAAAACSSRGAFAWVVWRALHAAGDDGAGAGAGRTQRTARAILNNASLRASDLIQNNLIKIKLLIANTKYIDGNQYFYFQMELNIAQIQHPHPCPCHLPQMRRYSRLRVSFLIDLR